MSATDRDRQRERMIELHELWVKDGGDGVGYVDLVDFLLDNGVRVDLSPVRRFMFTDEQLREHDAKVWDAARFQICEVVGARQFGWTNPYRAMPPLVDGRPAADVELGET